MLEAAWSYSMGARAQEAGLVTTQFANPRDFAYDAHRKVDDRPYGGGPGMVIKVEPVALAIERLSPEPGSAIVLTDPGGIPFGQATAREWAQLPGIVFLCGHYEGFDHRVETMFATHVVSVGDYVLTGGELPALTMADATLRLIPGVLGCAESLEIDAHTDGLLSAPQYTRPESFRGVSVPEELISGDHKKVERWKRSIALKLTQSRRPDLLLNANLAKEDLDMLRS